MSTFLVRPKCVKSILVQVIAFCYQGKVLICITSQSFIVSQGINELTYCGLVMPYGNINLGQHWLGNDLLPDSTKPLSEQMLISH